MANVQVAEEEVHIRAGEAHSSSVAGDNSFWFVVPERFNVALDTVCSDVELRRSQRLGSWLVWLWLKQEKRRVQKP